MDVLKSSLGRPTLAGVFVRLMMTNSSDATVYGMANAGVPLILVVLLTDLGPVRWLPLSAAVALITMAFTFLGLFMAVAVSEISEAQTFSNFFPFAFS
ncbi:hypothetical protein [Desulfosoma caldarium]|uniref:hypothetical protein n=1 Tax=Desulfosoma caldarium TaxID=610254 RepID=UPI000F49ABF3|nr:hypothetical protein [Desulfosoma caldarium]